MILTNPPPRLVPPPPCTPLIWPCSPDSSAGLTGKHEHYFPLSHEYNKRPQSAPPCAWPFSLTAVCVLLRFNVGQLLFEQVPHVLQRGNLFSPEFCGSDLRLQVMHRCNLIAATVEVKKIIFIQLPLNLTPCLSVTADTEIIVKSVSICEGKTRVMVRSR